MSFQLSVDFCSKFTFINFFFLKNLAKCGDKLVIAALGIATARMRFKVIHSTQNTLEPSLDCKILPQKQMIKKKTHKQTQGVCMWSGV